MVLSVARSVTVIGRDSGRAKLILRSAGTGPSYKVGFVVTWISLSSLTHTVSPGGRIRVTVSSPIS